MQLMMLRTAAGHAAGGQTFSGYSSGRRSPIGIGGAIAVHALVVGAWLLMPKEIIDSFREPPLITYPVDDTPPPPKQAQPETNSRPQPNSHPTVVEKPSVNTPSTVFTAKADDRPSPEPSSGTGTVTPPVNPPIPDPVLVDATIDPRALAAFQPDYPGAMIRQGLEGKVIVRVTIGPDGRVVDIERLSASDETFWLATQRHALRKWRFRPATRDGVAISSSKVLTVHFRLADV